MTTNISHTTCNLNNGSITINASNTTGTVQYSLNGNAQSTNVFSNLASGNYTVLVTDGAGCTASNISVVNASTALNISTQTTNANCGINQGSITVNVSSGTSPYSYNFGFGNQSSNTATNLPSGNYTVTVTDASSCTKTAQAVIQSTPAVSFTTQTTPAFCGSNNGTISIFASGGNGNFTYSTGGSFVSTSIFSNLPASTYSVTVQDGNGCTSTQSVIVSIVSNLNATITVTSTITCPGGNNGALLVNTSGGSPTFNYAWSNNQTSASISNLSAATYTVTVTDALGCQKTASQTVTQPSAFSINPTSNPASCFGTSSGSITVNVSGATPPYQYSLNGGNFQTSNQFSNLGAGTYALTVKDASQCTSSASVVVSQNTAISASTQATNVLCFGQSNGSIIVNATGGVSPYLYAINSGNFQASNSFSGLAAGTYQITVKDANNCTLNVSQAITQPAAISATASTQTVTCFGQSNGSITVNASGGTVPLQFNLNGGTFQTQNSFTNLAAGNYNIIVKDANNCQFPLAVTISQPTAIQVNAQSSPSTCSNSQNGSITLLASGGNGPYQYSINGGTPNSSGVFTGLAAGTYSYLVTGASQCSASGNVTILSPPVLNIQLSGNPVSCSGGNNGVITVSASGGTAPYQYSINGGNLGSSATFTGLSAGTYNLQVQDNNACIVSNTYTITQPGTINLSANATNVSCFGLSNGSATAQAQGGSSGFMYSWSNGATGSSINNIPAGTYSVTATDSNGCNSTAAVAVTQPASLIVNVQSTPLGSLGASDGTASAIVSGGTATYNYQWSNGQTTSSIQNLPAGTYNVTVTDANNCSVTGSVIIAPFNCNLSASAQNIAGVSCFGFQNGGATIVPSNGQSPYTFLWPGAQTTATVNNLAAGNYAITVADAASCQAIVNLTISQPQQLEIALAATDVSCFGGNNGTLNALASGGVAPYTYSINATDFQASGLFSGLVSGNYTISIKDASQCVRTFNGVIGSPTALAVQLQSDTILCHGSSTGNVLSTVTGGLAPYFYVWSNGSQAANLQGVPSNSYGLSVTDSKGCIITSSASISQNDSLYLEIQITQPTAEVLNNGRIEINPKGGTAPYNVMWNNQSTEKILSDLLPGTYQVIITDDNGCILITNIVLSDPTCALSLELIHSSQITCHGGSDGSIGVQVEGTSLPYEIIWSNGIQTSSAEGLNAGMYIITAEDERGCLDTLNILLTQPDPLELESIEGPEEAVTQNEVIYTTNLLPGMTYEWSCSNGQIFLGPQPNEITVIWLQAGEQTLGVEVTDVNGCSALQVTEVFVGTNSIRFDEMISGIKVFPNPFSEGIWIQSETFLSKPVSIILMDLRGKVMRTGILQNQLEWNLDNLPSGLYLLKAEDRFFKLVKQ
ncbi:MAG: T9SS type A sorting domain-containing protein [Saprospiraceae bacterium]|nr:T9SS type A sorting domain-containing protein [Saprospiraceae bacterium]